MFHWRQTRAPSSVMMDEIEPSSNENEKQASYPLHQFFLYDNLLPDQLATLSLFKNQIQESDDFCTMCKNDLTLLRFLRARNFDLGKATFMLQESLKWRKEFDVEHITTVEQFPFSQELAQYYPRGFHGIDKCGRPIYIDCIGKLQLDKALQVAERSTLLRRYAQEYEFLSQIILPACSIQAKRTIEQTFTIVDLRGLTFSMFNMTTKRYISDMAGMSQNNYPEILGEMCFIGVSRFFRIIWAFLKNLLDARTESKITLLCCNDKWREYLLERIDAHQLPLFLGGTRDCDDTWSNMDFGPWMDPKILQQVYQQNNTIPKNLFRLSFVEILEKDFDEFFRQFIKKEETSSLQLTQPASGDISDSSETTNERSDTDRVVEL
ncbi:hypothetical protein IE077_002823 [Cardiosporidium cionae]|uniref:CRAL-TRIO domain-containing protein n=1 Tax=Cardiosporidium cionae TaxID=476202 RepID=A0ABQ7JAU6_9APIC|nr:hypothetical protein IE077_002823 [Cardiosporidium cionae]|eukprot:KAF8820780.1 hypothetical protein IE077_002823 [Cardiosporidium cionae]